MKLDFLKKTNKKVQTLVKKNTSFLFFLSNLKKSNIDFVTKFDFEATLKRAEELNEVLNIISSIVSKPHFITTTSEIVLRSELSSRLSRESFNETIKDTKLWKHKGNELIPEYVHTVESIDTIVTYENKFIARLIDFISDEASDLLNDLLPLMESLEEKYEHKGIGFNEHSLLNDLSELPYPYNDIFINEGGNKRKLFNLIKKVNKRALILRNTDFYIQNKKEQLVFPILLTNILIHDKLYAYSYRFYKDNYLGNTKDDASKDYDFYNYFVANFFYELTRNKGIRLSESKKSKIYLDEENNLRFENIVFRNKLFTFTLNDDLTNLGIKLDISFNNEYKKENENLKLNGSTNYIKLVFSYKEINKVSVKDDLMNLNETYDNVILATLYNDIKDYINVMSLSLYKDNHEIMFKNLINSLSLVFNDTKGIFIAKCPICGENEIKLNKLDYECESCHAKFSLFDFKKSSYMWIKSLRRAN